MKAGEVLLEAAALQLRIGGRTLCEGLDLVVRRGELWAVLGRNGSGKTSLLHALAGLRAPDAGVLRLAGRELDQWSGADAACLRGLLPQSLHDAFSAQVQDVVLLGRHPHRQGGVFAWGFEDEDDGRVAQEALRAVDMDGLAQRDVLSLSGGERQRVAIAALLAQQPLLLLLDEPTSHLDLHHQVMVLAHLRRLARDGSRAVVMSLHDLNLARRFATHALLLGGTAPIAGPVDEVMSEARLSAAFGHAVHRLEVASGVVYVAA
jgi:iron complex transport system ATP-binding protein